MSISCERRRKKHTYKFYVFIWWVLFFLFIWMLEDTLSGDVTNKQKTWNGRVVCQDKNASLENQPTLHSGGVAGKSVCHQWATLSSLISALICPSICAIHFNCSSLLVSWQEVGQGLTQMICKLLFVIFLTGAPVRLSMLFLHEAFGGNLAY